MVNLGTVDIVVFAITLLVSLGIGLFFAIRGHNDTDEYLLGNRNMPLIPTTLSILVSFFSGILILGGSSEMYMKGTHLVWDVPGIVLGIVLAIYIYVPVFYNLEMTSVYEYLFLRFKSKIVRYIGSIFFIITMLVYIGVVLYAPCTALSGITGINQNLLIAMTGISCTLYTTLGGLKAVVWTDAFQAVVMYGGLMAIIIQGLVNVGGVERAWELAYDGGRITTEWSLNPFVYMNFWSVFFGTGLGWMAIYGTQQSAVQRYCSMSTLRRAKWSVILVAPGALILVPLVYACGLVMYSYYSKCDPIMSKQVDNRDQLITLYTMDILGHLHGLTGVFISALFSGTLSSVSSSLNSLAAVTWEDFIRKNVDVDDRKATRISKSLVVIYGVIGISISYICPYLGGVLQATMTLLMILDGPASGLFLLGILFPWATAAGALSGVVGSAGIMSWICVGAQMMKPYRESLPRVITGCSNDTLAQLYLINSLNITNSTPIVEIVTNPTLTGISYIYTLSYQMYGLASILLVFIIGVPVSLATVKTLTLSDNDKHLIWPGWWIIFKMLPASTRERYNLNAPRKQPSKNKIAIDDFEIVAKTA